jgi:microcystin-dependent protein
MSTPFLGEIKIVSFNFAPRGWALCNGQLLPINQNQALFAVFGTTYGGDGRVTFGLPNLQGRTPFHQGPGFALGQQAGEQAVTLNISQIPAHTHVPAGSSATQTLTGAGGSVWCKNASVNQYAPAGNTAMNPAAISVVGGNQPHPNMSPYLVLNFVVALQGIFPSQN